MFHPFSNTFLSLTSVNFKRLWGIISIYQTYSRFVSASLLSSFGFSHGGEQGESRPVDVAALPATCSQGYLIAAS